MSIEYIVITLSSSVLFEYNQLTEYTKYVALFSIIEHIPSAMCIVDEEKKMMLYSNAHFEKLASTLN